MPYPERVKAEDVKPRYALLLRGSGRPETCPKCGSSIPLAGQEPCFAHCRMCGTLTPVKGTTVANQVAFERSSGLAEHAWSEEGRMYYKPRKPKNGNGKA